jgi:hypothetical protein
MFSEEKLRELALRGLIVGPHESEADFALRIEKAVKQTEVDLSEFYGISPDWLDVEEEKGGLSWFQGAATWIEGDQVKIKTKRNLFVSYEEMLRHEAVHAVRCQFEEKGFEEILAYATSSRKYRRLIGPLFRSDKETLLLLSSCFLGFFFPFLPYVVIGGYGLRLAFYHKRLSSALKKIKQMNSMWMAIHLTDKEILHFTPDLIKQDSLRWRQIRARFFLTIS